MNEPLDRALVYRVFSEALETETGERNEFIAARCRGSPVQEQLVRKLLAIAEAGDATGILLAGGSPPLPDRIGREYGRFRLLELLGLGGMGAVYRAERTDGVPQTVAIKVLRDSIGAATSSHFAREAKILAGLEHPSIARLIDVGVRDGEAWIAMEFVRGQQITTYCDAASLDIRARVRLLLALADAIATAHRRLIVHRDIKPSNVLVSENGQPKLIDFGIAYALQGSGPAREATVDVSRLFSPHYAAPEQVKGEPVTVATDVFGLGALAYRVLSGCEPFAQATSAVSYLFAVTHNDVAAPSEAARASGMDPAQMRKLQGDLDSILMKALDRDPARRYVGVDALQYDLRAYLDGRPVNARAATWPYRFAKFARRHVWGLGAASVAVLGLSVAAVIYGLQERRVTQALEAAARRGTFLESMLKSADPRHHGNREMTVAQLLDASLKDIGDVAAEEPLAAASMLGLVAETDLNLGRFSQGLEATTREIEILRARQGSKLELAGALTLRGELLISTEADREAEVPLREARALVEHRKGAEVQLAAVLESLAKAAQNQGLESEAEALYKREIEANGNAGDAVGGKAGFPLAGLGAIRFDQGRYAESTAYIAQALEIEKKYFPPDHPDLLDAQYNYAVALETNQEAAKAEPIFRSLLTSYRRILGPRHSDTFGAQEGLAHDLFTQQRYQEAADEALQAAVGLSGTVGEQSSWTDTAWGVYGISACLSGQGEAGLAALRRAVTLRAKRTGSDSWTTMSTSVHLGVCLVRLHRYDEAEPLLLKAVAILENSRDKNLERTLTGYRALRDLYAQTGRAEESAIWQRKMLPGHP
jgi:tetratricopeptide (TPR) repeat protein/predicted Ser/Thr protein kinase